MSATQNHSKARLIRRHLLQLARELYLHPQRDVTMAENLKGQFHDIDTETIQNHFLYLAERGLLAARRTKNGMSAQITAKGIDVLDGAAAERGVEPTSPHASRLAYKKEIRRVVLQYCYTFRESFNEDAEIMAEFASSGFSNLLPDEVRFHMWYLRHKGCLELKTPTIAGEMVFMAKITADGVDVVEQNRKEPGISHEAE